jgi:RNA polymerase sigma factor (sigma-70 family)
MGMKTTPGRTTRADVDLRGLLGMSPVTTSSVARQIGSLFDGGSVAGMSDRQLIERFNNERESMGDAAFAALVTRHGGMVWHVCRELLGDRHHAEDAFQAVFLVLARKARSIRNPDLLGNWLYGVAVRTARKAQGQIARRRKNEEADRMNRRSDGSNSAIELVVEPADRPVLLREQAEVLYSEINRLPSPFRLPIVLCYLEGLTLDEAAHRLKCPAGTVRSRLARACDKLRRGLIHRGVALPAVALTAALDTRPASASVLSSLCDITTKAAMNFVASGTAAPAVTFLAQEVLISMFVNRLKFAVSTLIVLGAAAVGAGLLAQAPARQTGKPDLLPIAKADDAIVKPAPGRMFVVGRVVDPAGKPMARIPVEVIGRPRRAYSVAEGFGSSVLLGRSETDGAGCFRLDAPRTTSVGFYDDIYVLTAALGFGIGWAALNADAEQPTAEVCLHSEQIIRGRLVDVNGQPTAGVELRIDGFGEAKNLGLWSETSLYTAAPEEARTWPRRPRTDEHGRFELRGVGRGHFVSFLVDDLRFAQQWLGVATDDHDGPKEVTLALEPPKIIEGRILATDTGQPIPFAAIDIGADRKTGIWPSKFRADARGQFRANAHPADHFTINAFPPEGLPYLSAKVGFDWTKGAVKREIDVKLSRGVAITGNVTEEGTGRALAGASVQYLAIDASADCNAGWEAMVASKNDGSYQIVVPPGKGHLLVFGPTADFVLEVIGGQMLFEGKPGGERHYAHKIVAYETTASNSPHVINAALRPGQTVKGRVTGPKGETIAHATILTPLYIEPFNPTWRGDAGFQRHARDGRFELHGLEPGQSARAYFLDADHQWGAAVELSGKRDDEEVTVPLQLNGQAKARFIGLAGQPVANWVPRIEIVVTPGPTARRGVLSADAGRLIQVDPKHYWRPHPLVTDADGRVTFPDLIPGALYRISDFGPNSGWQERDFTVKPDETLDLGDILIEKP